MKEKENEALSLLGSQFEVNGWPLHVDEQKLYERASVNPSDTALSQWVVEIERHRPILGMTYTKDLRMGAFETYFMRYAVDLETNAITELPERRGEIAIEVDDIVDSELSSECFHLRIRRLPSGKYEICEQVGNDRLVASSLKEARVCVESLGEKIADSFLERLGTEKLAEVGYEGILSAFHKTLAARLTAMAEDLWKRRDEENGDD